MVTGQKLCEALDTMREYHTFHAGEQYSRAYL